MKLLKNLDLTKGNILKSIVLFTIPILIGNVFQQLYNFVDAVIVGQTMGSNAYVAVGVTGSLTFLVLGFANGLASGLACGSIILTVCVISILISAPVGALLIDSTYKKLLKQIPRDIKNNYETS